MRFLLDMNLSPAVGDQLRAAEARRVVVTFDLDFGDIAAVVDGQAAGVILLRLKLARSSHVWDRLQVAIAQTAEALAAGAIVLAEDARIRIRRTRPED